MCGSRRHSVDQQRKMREPERERPTVSEEERERYEERDTAKKLKAVFCFGISKGSIKSLVIFVSVSLQLTYYSSTLWKCFDLCMKTQLGYLVALQFSNDRSVSLTVDGRLTASFPSVFHWDGWLHELICLIHNYYAVTANTVSNNK